MEQECPQQIRSGGKAAQPFRGATEYGLLFSPGGQLRGQQIPIFGHGFHSRSVARLLKFVNG